MRSVIVRYPSGKVGDITVPETNDWERLYALWTAYDAAVSGLSDTLSELILAVAPREGDHTEGAVSFARREHERRIRDLRDLQAELSTIRDDLHSRMAERSPPDAKR